MFEELRLCLAVWERRNSPNMIPDNYPCPSQMTCCQRRTSSFGSPILEGAMVRPIRVRISLLYANSVIK